MVGAHVVIAEKFSATQFWKQATDCGATFAHTIFTLPPILKAQPPSQWDRAHKLRAMYNANSDPEFEKRFNVRLVEAYGLTETGLTRRERAARRRRRGRGAGGAPQAAVDHDERLSQQAGRDAAHHP
jgi:crotonobetaine/carnitine-CoA ligase